MGVFGCVWVSVNVPFPELWVLLRSEWNSVFTILFISVICTSTTTTVSLVVVSVSMLLIWCTHANLRNARSQLIFRFCWMSMPSIPMDLNNLSSKLFYFVSVAVVFVVVGFPCNSGYWVGKNFYSAINCDSGTFRSNLMPFGWRLFENLMMNLLYCGATSSMLFTTTGSDSLWLWQWIFVILV